MRLTQDEQRALRETVAVYVAGEAAQLLLYGSRVHDERRGGDIDLALRTSAPLAARLRKQKIALLLALKQRLGDQRLDLSFISDEEAREDPFYRLALKGAVVLAEFAASPRV